LGWSAPSESADNVLFLYSRKNAEADYTYVTSVLANEGKFAVGADGYISTDVIEFILLNAPVNSLTWKRDNEAQTKVAIPIINDIEVPKVEAKMDVDNEGISLSWSASVCSYDRYKLYRECDGEFDKNWEVVDVSGMSEYIDTKVEACKSYSYYIQCEIKHTDEYTIIGQKSTPVLYESTFEVTSPLNVSKGIYPDKVVLKWSVKDPKIVEKYESNEITADESIKALQENYDESVTSLLVLPLSLTALGICVSQTVKEVKDDEYSF
jgi:hypothetical protein